MTRLEAILRLLSDYKNATRYRKALQGIASCSTRCGCCEMHRRIAELAIKPLDCTGPTNGVGKITLLP